MVAMDKYFRVEVIACTQPPARAIWYGMHQCVAEKFALDDPAPTTEESCGDAIVKHLLPAGHWSPLEHATITLNFGGFSHRVMQQFTRSRIGVSPSVQSFRYTGNRIARLAQGIDDGMRETKAVNLYELLEVKRPSLAQDVDALFYQRSPGEYRDRHGIKEVKTIDKYVEKRIRFAQMARWYAQDVEDGEPYESAAGGLPMDARQDWVATFNARSICGFFDRRTPADAQLEIRQLCDLTWPHFENWLPSVATWFRKNRWGKNKLAP
jgi:thymidylate synthase (FAD)